MLDLVPAGPQDDIVPGRKLAARAAGVYSATGEGFETRVVDELVLDYAGIRDDFHFGITRRSGGREPWYARGTEMRNARQVSIIAADEMAVVAERMGIAMIEPGWIGANLVIEGVPNLSMLPAGSLLFFKGGATLKVDAQNHPCRFAGRLLAERAGMADPEAGAIAFAKMAKRLRGLVAWVEKPGAVRAGEEISVRVPEQWIYRG